MILNYIFHGDILLDLHEKNIFSLVKLNFGFLEILDHYLSHL